MATSLPNIDLDIVELQPQRYQTSGPTRDRCAGRRQGKSTKGGISKCKRGKQPTFKGARADFLADHIDGLRDCKGGARNGHAHFWHRFFSLYWAKFNWQLPLDRDPKPDDVWKADKECTAEELEMKGKIIKKTQQVRIQNPPTCSCR